MIECCALSDGKEFESRSESLEDVSEFSVDYWNNPARGWNTSTCVESVQSSSSQQRAPSSSSIDSPTLNFSSFFWQQASPQNLLNSLEHITEVKHSSNFTLVYVSQSSKRFIPLLTCLTSPSPCAFTTKPSSSAATSDGATASSNAHASTARARPAA